MWFQDYKIPDGKPANKFGFDNQPQNKEFTLNVRPAPLNCRRAPTQCQLVALCNLLTTLF